MIPPHVNPNKLNNLPTITLSTTKTVVIMNKIGGIRYNFSSSYQSEVLDTSFEPRHPGRDLSNEDGGRKDVQRVVKESQPCGGLLQ